MKHQGKIVFVEAVNGKSGYYNGEYFVLRETPASLYVTKLDVGYGGHEMRMLSKVGSEAYNVIEVWDDMPAVRQWIQGQRDYLAQQSRADKKQYIESVYSGILNNIRRAEELLTGAVVVQSVGRSDEIAVDVPQGTKRIVLNWV